MKANFRLDRVLLTHAYTVGHTSVYQLELSVRANTDIHTHFVLVVHVSTQFDPGGSGLDKAPSSSLLCHQWTHSPQSRQEHARGNVSDHDDCYQRRKPVE